MSNRESRCPYIGLTLCNTECDWYDTSEGGCVKKLRDVEELKYYRNKNQTHVSWSNYIKQQGGKI